MFSGPRLGERQKVTTCLSSCCLCFWPCSLCFCRQSILTSSDSDPDPEPGPLLAPSCIHHVNRNLESGPGLVHLGIFLIGCQLSLYLKVLLQGPIARRNIKKMYLFKYLQKYSYKKGFKEIIRLQGFWIYTYQISCFYVSFYNPTLLIN